MKYCYSQMTKSEMDYVPQQSVIMKMTRKQTILPSEIGSTF